MDLADKSALRVYFKNIRGKMTHAEKNSKDSRIFSKLVGIPEFASAGDILTYVSSDIEVDTEKIISYSFDQGKSVYAPRCVRNTNIMRFYRITGFDDLEAGYFGIREPKKHCEELKESQSQICLVPALSYDAKGYRLGFGKGFYDRFLPQFRGISIGLCYDSCISDQLPGLAHDMPVSILVTETKIIRFSNYERTDKQNG
ncbi:5-formyltetrahydrofolate cyclo-ligase [Ruminococcus sp. Marseille-P6503]|uniref:5-formyltetrahydrofolate cyclo-ligase n=1 Tax=Ruminococcus sp. Marseille-P6503 TaxID=2364796 RepID=UPI000F5290C7|nr:5-formyltetrahydrofolate cyclo-ligase [Ruminococcus sp. Marseille-P6503]